jgi:RNA polymerase subunit RPABC4/transcription elongation factor Spt4
MSKDVCPNCGSNDLTEGWIGFVIITNTEKSILAPVLEVKTNGKYAVKIK